MTKYNRYRQAAACGCLNPAERGTLGAGAARGAGRRAAADTEDIRWPRRAPPSSASVSSSCSVFRLQRIKAEQCGGHMCSRLLSISGGNFLM